MQLPQSKERQVYIDTVKEIESDLTNATSETVDFAKLSDVQRRVDELADTYQYKDSIGSARYKLYELQSFIHYFRGDDEEALNFINQAIDLRGDSYSRAEKLKFQLQEKSMAKRVSTEKPITKAERRKKLIGLEGWFAVFIVTLFISIIWTVFNFFKDGVGLSAEDIAYFNDYQVGLGDTMVGLVSFENIAIGIYVALLVSSVILIFRKRKVAKVVTVIALIFGAVYGIVDYAIAYSVFSDAGLSTEYFDELASSITRGVLYALVWSPYLLLSKRVKATLTN